MENVKIFGLTLLPRQTHIVFCCALILLTICRSIGMVTLDLPLYGDEAQYWTWSNELALGYYSKPPLLAWIINFFTSLFGDTPVAIRLGALLTYPLSVIAIYRLAHQMLGHQIAFWSGLLFLVSPGVTFSSLIISTDPLLFMFWSWGLLSFWNALKSDKLYWWVLLGIFVGLGLLSKYAMFLFVGSMFLVIAFDPLWKKERLNKKFWLSLGIGLLILFPNIYWNIVHGFVSFFHTIDNANLKGEYFKAIYPLKYIAGQIATLGILHFPILFYLYVITPSTVWRERHIRFLFLFSAPILLFFFLKETISGGHANWSAPAYISGSIIITWWCCRSHFWHRILKIVIGIHVFLMLAFYNYEPILEFLEIPRTKMIDPLARYKKWDEIAEGVEKILHKRGLINITPGQKAVIISKYDENPFNIASDDRMVIAVLKYYLREYNLPILKWNPNHLIKDHYDLTTTLEDKISQDVILISAKLQFLDVKKFGEVQELQDITVNPAYDFSRTYKVFLIRNFKGYHFPKKENK